MTALKRFVELKYPNSSINYMLALEDIVTVHEEMRAEMIGKELHESKELRIITIQREHHLCDYSHYAMLKHYLVETWEK
jgi:hypothetical protein